MQCCLIYSGNIKKKTKSPHSFVVDCEVSFTVGFNSIVNFVGRLNGLERDSHPFHYPLYFILLHRRDNSTTVHGDEKKREGELEEKSL